MPRIQPLSTDSAPPATAEMLANVKSKLGVVPNLVSTLANSPAAAQAYLDFSGALAGGVLPPRLREQIALAVGEANACDYCVSAHTVLGQAAGLTEQQTCDARTAASDDPREAAALHLARAVVDHRGHAPDELIAQARTAGYTDAELVEVVAHVALNLFTNYFNHFAQTTVDFPAAPTLAAG